MIDIRTNGQWPAPDCSIIPTANITAADQNKLDVRQNLIERLRVEAKKSSHWARINSGLFKGSIFEIAQYNDRRSSRTGISVLIGVEKIDHKRNGRITYIPDGLDDKSPDWAYEHAYISFMSEEAKPIRFKEGTIYNEYLPTGVLRGMSLLLDYTGGEVFCMNAKKRPATFEDRLGQEVAIGDLAVVAYNYGGGLDLVTIDGYADETRVVVKSVSSGDYDRIPLDDNATHKIMRMPNKIEDMALMMKLARR